MVITLYKNTQTEGETVYKDLWQLSPYEPSDLFASGFTSERAEYVIPDGFKIIRQGKSECLEKADYPYEIFTNMNGKPGIRILHGGGVFCNGLLKQGEEPPKAPEPVKKSNAWVPGYDKNGELEIF